MALPTVKINNSTGSDTAASGAGPATAVTGTAAAHTNGSASTTITLTNTPNLSGVATDGSAVLWLKTSSGRQFSKITAVDDGADTVTVEDSFNISAGTPVNYAIGGKRATLDNTDTRALFADSKAGWTIDLEETGSNYTITSTLTITCAGDGTNGYIHLTSSSVTRPLITTSTNSVAIFTYGSGGGTWEFSNFRMSSTAGTRGNGITSAFSGHYSRFLNIEMDGFAIGYNLTAHTRCKFERVEIKNCTSHGISARQEIVMIGCYIHNNSGHGVLEGGFAAGSYVAATNCVFANNGNDGIRIQISSAQCIVVLSECVFYGNTSDGLGYNTASAQDNNLTVVDSTFYGNGAYGIEFNQNVLNTKSIVQNCAFGSNTSGAYNNLTVNSSNITLTADPFTNAAGGVFTLNATSGGGALMREAGYPGLNSLFGDDYSDIGPLQRQASAGGSIGAVQGLNSIEAGIVA